MEDPMEVEEAREVEASPNDGDGASPSEGQGEEEHHIENSPGAPDAAPDTAPDTAPDSSPLLVDEALPSEPSEAPTNGPVYRRKLKKLAAVGAEEVGPSGAGTGLAEEGGKNEGGSGKVVTKGESGKKRKPGFQKKDKGQVEEALVWMEGEFEIGDLVWTRLKGHPWWPSQVFDPEKASNKARKLQKPGHLLIAFFGDETFAWHKPEDLVPFEANLDVKAKQSGGGRLFQDAIEAAQEELERQKAAARGIVIEDPEEREERLRKERADTEKDAIADYDPDRILQYIRALALQPLDCPPDEPSRIQALAYRSVVHHEEKEHPSKAGVLPGWRPILKEEPKRKPKPKPAEVDSSDDDVPILKSPKTPKPQKTPKTPKVSSAGDGSEPEKKRRGWPKGKPRGKKTPKEGDPMTPADGSEKKRRRKRVKDTEGVSPSAKFDTLVAAIDDIEGRDKEEADELGDENESRKQARRERGGDASGGASADAGERVKGEGNGLASPGTEARRIRKEVKIVAPKVKRATRDEAGEELGALLDKLRTIAQEPLENDPASEEFRETSVKYVDYRQYQIARAKARYQRSFNYAAGISPRAPPPAAEKRKAPQSVLRVPSEGGAPKRRKEAPVTRKEEVGEKPKVKRVRKKKMRVDETEKGEGEKEGPEREGDESTDEDVPLQKRMKIHADSALPPRKQVGTSTPAERIAEYRRRMLGVKGGPTSPKASDKGVTSPKGVLTSPKASEGGGKAPAGDPPAKPFEPLALFMRFPERFAVPTEAQLKASFVRFGELATYRGATRVLPHKSAAQVVFKRSEDADAAFKYCRANTMFGNPRVRYELREVVFQEVGAKKGRPNGNAPRSPHAMTYDELLKEPANPGPAVPSYRPIQSRVPPLQGPVAALGPPGGAKAPAKSILKDPRRPPVVRQSLLLSSAMETLMNPPPVKPPVSANAPPLPYVPPRPSSTNFPMPPSTPYTSQPSAYPPQQTPYTGQSAPYPSGQPAAYTPQSSSAAPSYGPRPPAYGPNQSLPPAYAARPPPGRPPFNHPPAAYDPARPGYGNQFNHPPAPPPPLPSYPRGQQPAPPAYAQQSARPQAAYTAIFSPPQPRPNGAAPFAGHSLPPPPPPMPAPPQQIASEVQKFADLLQVLSAQGGNLNPVQNPNSTQNPSTVQNSAQNPQTLPPPPAPMPERGPSTQASVDRSQQAAAPVPPSQGVPGLAYKLPDAKEMHQERIGELIGEAAGPEDESFRDMLEQLLNQAAELQANNAV